MIRARNMFEVSILFFQCKRRKPLLNVAKHNSGTDGIVLAVVMLIWLLSCTLLHIKYIVNILGL